MQKGCDPVHRAETFILVVHQFTWMSMQRVSRVRIGGWLILILRCLILWPLPTPLPPYLAQYYCRAELDKKRKYDERICKVERGTFSPLVFPLPVAWVPQLQLFTNKLPLWVLRRGVIPTAMYCIGLDVVSVFAAPFCCHVFAGIKIWLSPV